MGYYCYFGLPIQIYCLVAQIFRLLFVLKTKCEWDEMGYGLRLLIGRKWRQPIILAGFFWRERERERVILKSRHAICRPHGNVPYARDFGREREYAVSQSESRAIHHLFKY